MWKSLSGNSAFSSTTSETCEWNTVATLNDIGNDIKGKRKYWDSPGRPDKQYTVTNHEELVKEESVKDIDSKISGISAISGKQNTVKNL